MNINYAFDTSTNPKSWATSGTLLTGQSALQTAQSAFQAAANLYTTLFSNNVTLNIDVQWGAVQAGAAANNNGGGGGLIFNYGLTDALMLGDENSPVQKLAFASLPSTDPTGSNNFSMTIAEAEALGLSASTVNTLYTQAYGSPVPTITIQSSNGQNVTANSTVEFSNTGWTKTPSPNGQNWTYNSFFNVALHEISEIMGRSADVGLLYSGAGSLNGPETNQALYTPLDLFRYTASGQFDASYGTATNNSLAYFGFDGGHLVSSSAFNNGIPGVDRADWVATANPNGDPFGAASNNTGILSETDLTEMNLLGWNFANLTVAQAQSVYAADPAPSLSLTVVDSAVNVSQNMDALQTLAANGDIGSITFNDLIPTLSVKNYQLLADTAVFPLITQQYLLSIGLSVIPITFALPGNVPYVTLTGSGDVTLVGNSLNDVFNIDAQGNHTIQAGGTGSYTITGSTGTTTLDYSSVTGYLTVDVGNGTVTKPGGSTLSATDNFAGSSAVTAFDGGSGINTFKSAAIKNYTFIGNGASNTLDYSAAGHDITVNLGNHTVAKDGTVAHSQDSFSDIQTFIGSPGANDTINFSGPYVDATGTPEYSITNNRDGSVTVRDLVNNRDGTITADHFDLHFTDGVIKHEMIRWVSDPSTPNDLFGNGHSDLLWRNVDGTTVAWEMNGGTKLADVNLNAIPNDWSIQDTGDFFGTGRTGDILWRHAGDGQTVLWEMNGGTKIADVNLNAIPTDWSVQGSGDFNGDGHADILWRHAGDGQTVLWEMNGGSKIADVNLNAITTDWKIQGIGDFNGDGKSDILWRNTNGQTVLWEMNGGQKLADVNLNSISTDWHVQGIGDFNGDGKSDILWRNDDGQTVLWEMNGGTKLADVNLNSIPTDWTLQFHHFDVV